MLLERIVRMGGMCLLFLGIMLITDYEDFLWVGFVQGLICFFLFGTYMVWYRQR